MEPISPDLDCFRMPRAYDPIVVAVLGARLQVVTLRGCVLPRRNYRACITTFAVPVAVTTTVAFSIPGIVLTCVVVRVLCCTFLPVLR